MTLLVTQMQNQDPLNPMDSSQMTTQLAQISTVSGISNVNSTLQALSDSYQSSQSIEATGLIGKGVLVPGTSLQLANGSAPFGMNLSAAASDVKVAVVDSSGRTVRTMDLGAQDAGSQAFQWDGTTDSGAASAAGGYTFSITAVNNGTSVSADTLSYGLVDSVTRSATGAVKLNVQNVGAVDLDQIQQTL
jgi:flagellar basal-body rod modification protein FlgD